MDENELMLGTRKIAIHILRTRDSAKVERMRQEAAATPREDPDEQALVEYFYPILFYCTDGDVPTAEEFLEMPLTQSNAWFSAVDDLNPGLLPGVQESEEKSIEKKEL